MFTNQATASSDQLRWATRCITELSICKWAREAYFFIYIERNSSFSWPADLESAIVSEMPVLEQERRLVFMTPRYHSSIEITNRDNTFRNRASGARVIGNEEAIQQLSSQSRKGFNDDTIGMTTNQNRKINGHGFLSALLYVKGLSWWPGMPVVALSEQDTRTYPGAGTAMEQLWKQMRAYQRRQKTTTKFGNPTFCDTGKGQGMNDDLVVALVLIMHYASNVIRRSGFVL